jgi:hypothetical protein
MVDLPSIPRRFVSVQAPTMNADPGAGQAMIGRALQGFGQSVSAFAEAQQQATDVAAANRVEAAWTREDVEARLKFERDPEGYDAYMKGFTEKLVADNPVSDKTKAQLTGRFEGARARTWGSMVHARSENLSKENVQSIEAANGDIENQMVAIANAGRTDSDEYRDLRARLERNVLTLVENPSLVYSKEQANSRLAALDGRMKASAAIGLVEKTYRETGSFAEAEKVAESIRTDPTMNLKENERDGYYRAALASIRVVETEKRNIVREFDRELGPMLPGILKGDVPEPQVRDFMERARDAGAVSAYGKAAAALAAQGSIKGIMALPGREREPALRGETATGVAGTVAPTRRFSPDVESAIDEAVKSEGVDAAVVRRYIQIESSGNPNNVTDSYKGLGQLSDEEFAKYTRPGEGGIMEVRANTLALTRKIKAETEVLRGKFGIEPTVGDLYLYHQQGPGGYANHMANPSKAAWENMATTAEGRSKKDPEEWGKRAIWGNIPDWKPGRKVEGTKAQFPGGVDTVTSADFVQLWRNKMEGTTGGGPVYSDDRRPGDVRREPGVVPARQNFVDPRVIAAVASKSREEIGPALDNLASSTRQFQNPPPEQVQDLVALTGAFGTAAQKERLADLLEQNARVSDAVDMPADQRAVRMDQMKQWIAKSGDLRVQQIGEEIYKTVSKVGEDYKKQPYETWATVTKREPLPQLNVMDPGQLAAGLQQRVKTQGAIRAHENLPAFSALSGKDKPAVEMALRSGDAAVIGSVLTQIATLDPEVAGATMKDLKAAVVGLTQTTDPNVYNATFQAIEAFADKAGIDAVDRVFDQNMVRDYQTWRGRYQYMGPDEMKDALRRDRDPAQAGVRSNARKTGLEEAVKVEEKTILGVFDDRTFSDPAAPADEAGGGVMTGRLLGDWRAIYAERRGDGMNPEQATADANERIKMRWGTTDVGGWRIMELPPEKQPGYKGVLAPSEMAEKLAADVAEWARGAHPDLMKSGGGGAAGPRGPASGMAVGSPAAAGLKHFLIPNPTTQADIKAGRPPSYWVGVTLPDGKIDIVKTTAGSPLSYHWRADAEARSKVDPVDLATAERRRRQSLEQEAIGREIQGGQMERRQAPIPSIGGPR